MNIILVNFVLNAYLKFSPTSFYALYKSKYLFNDKIVDNNGLIKAFIYKKMSSAYFFISSRENIN